MGFKLVCEVELFVLKIFLFIYCIDAGEDGLDIGLILLD